MRQPDSNDRGRPLAGTASNVDHHDHHIVTLIPTQLTHPKAVAPAFVVFTFDTDGAMVRRNVYLSLHSALKAKERAEKRGRRFEMILCELVPTPHKPLVVVGGAAG